MNLTPHFTLEEMTFSQTAARSGLDNTPSSQVVENLQLLCENALEPLRAQLNHPLQISSGYRSPQLNAAIHGAPNSQHVEGKAADILCPAIGTSSLFRSVVQLGIEFDQLIFEGTWVHVSFNQGNNRHNPARTLPVGEPDDIHQADARAGSRYPTAQS